MHKHRVLWTLNKKKRKNKRLMMKTQKRTRSHDWIETSTIKEYHPWQNKWYPDIHVLTPDDEGTPGGDVVLFLRVTAKFLSSCSLRIPSQWSVPIEPVQISVGRWSLELATGGFPLVYIKRNCFNRDAYVTLNGEDLTEVTCVVADMKAEYYDKMIENVDSLEIDTIAGVRNILKTLG